MKKVFLITSIALFVVSGISQEKQNVETELVSKTDFEVSIIQVFPDSFPQVSVVFQAKNGANEPLWLLDKGDFGIKENGFDCEVLDVRNISDEEPLNIALVFDHSGSMVDNPSQMPDSIETYQDHYFFGMLPEGYKMSIEYAKEGLLDFFSSDKNERDSLFFVGFSHVVDTIPALTNDYSEFENAVKLVQPIGSTAFYDALYNSIDSLKTHQSKPIIIGLTDGGDNSSFHTYEEVIDYANENGVRIYIIGLGFIVPEVLEALTSQTNGMFYYTTDPSKLTEIYLKIKRQLKSIYELDYVSNEDNSSDKDRIIEFYFKNDTLTFSNDTSFFELPEKVVNYLTKRKQELSEQAQFKDDLILYGGVGTATLVLGIGLFLFYRRKKKSLEIIKIYPNPTTGPISIEYAASEGLSNLSIVVTTVNGMQISSKPVNENNGSLNLNFSKLKKGIYIVSISSDSKRSKGVKVLKK